MGDGADHDVHPHGAAASASAATGLVRKYSATSMYRASTSDRLAQMMRRGGGSSHSPEEAAASRSLAAAAAASASAGAGAGVGAGAGAAVGGGIVDLATGANLVVLVVDDGETPHAIVRVTAAASRAVPPPLLAAPLPSSSQS